MFLGEIIKNYREENELTMDTFASMSGLSKGYISMLEKNQNPQNSRALIPSMQTFRKVAAAMGIETDSLVRMTDGKQPINIAANTDPDFSNITNLTRPAAKPIPILGTICAGDGMECIEEKDGYFFLDSSIKADYCLTIKGDSMIGVGIRNGDRAFIKKTYDYENGKIYAVVLKGENQATLKRFHQNGDTVILSPCNTQYEPIVTKAEDICIVGECVGTYHAMK